MKTRITITILIAVLTLLFCVAIGSVHIRIFDIFSILNHSIFGTSLPEHITDANVATVWSLRLPRVLLAFTAGATLAVSGAVMQSLLRNPLASSYTLGVSSGASLGASLVIFLGVSLPILTMMTLPILGFVFGLGTILSAVAIAGKIDKNMENHTIILTGMVFSLFINAITTLLFALFRESVHRMVFWQMGSFGMRGWSTLAILVPVALVGIFFVFRYKWEMDIMTFGEEQAQSIGVSIKRVKWILLIISAAITGSTIAFVGVIGFVDLVAPHVVRKLFGSAHKHVIPMSAVIGGTLMALCDLIARTIVAPVELPVGAVTAIIGAPFFAYVYLSRKGLRPR